MEEEHPLELAGISNGNWRNRSEEPGKSRCSNERQPATDRTDAHATGWSVPAVRSAVLLSPSACRDPGKHRLPRLPRRQVADRRAGTEIPFSLYVDEKKFAGVRPRLADLRRLPRRPAGERAPARARRRAGRLQSLPRRPSRGSRPSLHGQAIARGDRSPPGAPTATASTTSSRGQDPRSPVAPLQYPLPLRQVPPGRSARAAAARDPCRTTSWTNYSESIHGEGLLKKGPDRRRELRLLPHGASRSSRTPTPLLDRPEEHRQDLHEVPRPDRAVHRKVIQGELWEKEAHVLPGCPDCHQPHKVRKVFYDQGMADEDCMSCHGDRHLEGKHGRTHLFVDADDAGRFQPRQARLQPVPLRCQRLARAALRDHHKESGLRLLPRRDRRSSTSRAGTARSLARAIPTPRPARNATARTAILGKADPVSADLPDQRPGPLRPLSPRRGEGRRCATAATQHEIIEAYTESIHGKGLLKSGLTVTATCTSCHTAHSIQPRVRPHLQREPAQSSGHLRPLPPRHPGAVRAERPLHHGRQDRQAAPGLQRLPYRAYDPPGRRRRVQAQDHGSVRALP